MPRVAGELRTEIATDHVGGDGATDDPTTHDQHVHLVMLHTLVRGVVILAVGGVDAGKLVRGDAGPDGLHLNSTCGTLHVN